MDKNEKIYMYMFMMKILMRRYRVIEWFRNGPSSVVPIKEKRRLLQFFIIVAQLFSKIIVRYESYAVVYRLLQI